MKEINHECYVSSELAKLLRKAGFDWACREYYYNFTTTGWSLSFDDDFVNWNSWGERYISAPTLDVAQRWLREVKNIEAVPWRWPTKVMFVEGYKPWSYKFIEYRDLEGVDIEDFNASGEDYFKTYEEAQEAGIKKALELILEKGE